MTLPVPDDYGKIVDAVCGTVRVSALFRPAARIEAVPGPISDDWLSKVSINHGAVFAAVAAVDGIESAGAGKEVHTLNLGLYVVPAPAAMTRQAAALLSEVSMLASLIREQRWGLGGAGAPKRFRAMNRWSRALDGKGTSLWLLDWIQLFHMADSGLLRDPVGVSDPVAANA